MFRFRRPEQSLVDPTKEERELDEAEEILAGTRRRGYLPAALSWSHGMDNTTPNVFKFTWETIKLIVPGMIKDFERRLYDHIEACTQKEAPVSGGILATSAILEAIEAGDIVITPYDQSLVNGASVDVRLGDSYGVYPRWVQEHSDPTDRQLAFPFYRVDKVLDARKEPLFRVYEIPDDGIVIQPGILYLMHTHEVVRTDKYEPVLDGKSSIGRLGLFVHVTAAYGDPFFEGQYTLEVMSIHPVRIYKGMRIGQMRFHTLIGEPKNYQQTGNYVGEASKGPVPSKVFKQFKE